MAGGGVGHQMDGRPQMPNKLRFGVRIEVQHLPPPSTGDRIAIYFASWDVFSHDMIRTSVYGGGGTSKRTMLIEGEGGSKKSVFGRTCLMDDPYWH